MTSSNVFISEAAYITKTLPLKNCAWLIPNTDHILSIDMENIKMAARIENVVGLWKMFFFKLDIDNLHCNNYSFIKKSKSLSLVFHYTNMFRILVDNISNCSISLD